MIPEPPSEISRPVTELTRRHKKVLAAVRQQASFGTAASRISPLTTLAAVAPACVNSPAMYWEIQFSLWPVLIWRMRDRWPSVPPTGFWASSISGVLVHENREAAFPEITPVKSRQLAGKRPCHASGQAPSWTRLLRRQPADRSLGANFPRSVKHPAIHAAGALRGFLLDYAHAMGNCRAAFLRVGAGAKPQRSDRDAFKWNESPD